MQLAVGDILELTNDFPDTSNYYSYLINTDGILPTGTQFMVVQNTVVNTHNSVCLYLIHNNNIIPNLKGMNDAYWINAYNINDGTFIKKD